MWNQEDALFCHHWNYVRVFVDVAAVFDAIGACLNGELEARATDGMTHSTLPKA